MSTKNKYSVLMPTFNEKKNLPIMIYLILEQGKKHNLDFEIVIVDDASPDGTADLCRDLMKIYKNKIVLHERTGKLGLGSAYMDGLKFCTGNYVFICDADLSHHPKYMIDFINKQEETGSDIITGTRYRTGGGVQGWSLMRKLTSRVANFVASTTLGIDCTDLTGSFRLYKKEVIKHVINDIISRGYAFQMEIIVRALSYKYMFEEVPIIFVDRIEGQSKMEGAEITKFLKSVWKLYNTF